MSRKKKGIPPSEKTLRAARNLLAEEYFPKLTVKQSAKVFKGTIFTSERCARISAAKKGKLPPRKTLEAAWGRSSRAENVD